jgi:dGTPase
MARLYGPTDAARLVEETDPSLHYSPFRRDYARLVHSPAFRRLQGKTQLFPGFESDFFRNRLTHSIEVAQVAKAIALYLNSKEPSLKGDPIDPDIVEFAALAHDLGHPPFGHNGESALDACMRAPRSSMRSLTKEATTCCRRTSSNSTDVQVGTKAAIE